MKIIKLIIKNALRNKLRTFLTALGIAIAVIAFGLLSTIINAYFAGVEASSDTRLVVRNAVSLTFPLPIAYREKISKIPHVSKVSLSNWFGGTYIDERNFFAQFAVEPETFLELYPEYILTPEEKANFLKERNSCIVGEKLAAKYGWEIGDSFRIVGTIFPGDWDFVVRGIYKGKDKTTDETQMFFHWKYVDETLQLTAPGRGGQIGMFVIGIDKPENAVQVQDAVDATFANSSAETKTETEAEFQQSFISMVGTIITAIRVISIVVIVIILLVLANTMAMTARERVREYAVMKTLGFRPGHLTTLIFGESTTIAVLGGAMGLLLTFPIIHGFGVFLSENLGGFFPVFEMSQQTLIISVLAALSVGILAALFPTWQAVHIRIAEGLRRIG